MHDKDHQSRSNIRDLDRYYRLQFHSSLLEAVVVALEVVEVEVEEVEVVVVVVMNYLGSNHRKELRIHTKGNNSMILTEVVAVMEDIQGME
jgi:hypothetical protein